MTQSLKRLDGQVAIVTGAGGKPSVAGTVGTGRAMSVLFAREGAKILVVDRHEDRAEATRQQIVEEGGEAVTLVTNLADEASCQRVVDAAVEAFGRVDILVNNAAVSPLKSLLDTTEEILADSIGINLTVPFLLTKAAVRSMIENGGGSIVNISTIAALRGGAAVPAYAASKAGMEGLTRATAIAYGRHGIRVNAIAVGSVDTPLRRATDPNNTPRTHALRHEGTAWDIAKAAVFLASDDAAHITAVMLPVDAGATAMSA